MMLLMMLLLMMLLMMMLLLLMMMVVVWAAGLDPGTHWQCPQQRDIRPTVPRKPPNDPSL